MTNNDAIKRILGIDDIADLLKESSERGDEPCEFAVMQISPRTPIYEAIDRETLEQEKLCGTPLNLQMEMVGKGDPRAVVMFCMGVFRECAEAVTKPDKLASAFLRTCVACVYGFMWVQAWRLRLATVQTVRNVSRLASPFHTDDGDKLA